MDDKINAATRALDCIGKQMDAVLHSLDTKFGDWCKGKTNSVEIVSSEPEINADSESGWLCAASMTRYNLSKRGKRGRKKVKLYCAFQLSLAPIDPKWSNDFVLSVIALACRSDDNNQWECEDFASPSYLEQNWEVKDKPKGAGNKWDGRKGTDYEGCQAILVPLFDIKNPDILERRIIQPFGEIISKMLKADA